MKLIVGNKSFVNFWKLLYTTQIIVIFLHLSSKLPIAIPVHIVIHAVTFFLNIIKLPVYNLKQIKAFAFCVQTVFPIQGNEYHFRKWTFR